MTNHLIDTTSSASSQYYIETGRHLTVGGEDPRDVIREVLRNNADVVLDEIAGLLAMLGSKSEWDNEDNYCTTEAIAALAATIGLPTASDQSRDALLFYGTVWGSIDGEDFNPGTYVLDDEDEDGHGMDPFASLSH